MRSLVVLASLLLAGCALLPGPAAPEGIEHGGYVLACDGVAVDDCKQEADHVAGDIGSGVRIRWIIIRPGDGQEACWSGLLKTAQRHRTPVREAEQKDCGARPPSFRTLPNHMVSIKAHHAQRP